MFVGSFSSFLDPSHELLWSVCWFHKIIECSGKLSSLTLWWTIDVMSIMRETITCGHTFHNDDFFCLTQSCLVGYLLHKKILSSICFPNIYQRNWCLVWCHTWQHSCISKYFDGIFLTPHLRLPYLMMSKASKKL